MGHEELDDDGSIDNEPDFSDPEDFFDEISEDELLADLIRQRPKETDGMESVVVVDNIPVVGEAKFDKLKNVILKIFNKFGSITNHFFPMSERKETKGFLFLEYQNAQSATDAVKNANGYKLDKTHTFAVNLFSDFSRYKDVRADWKPPEKRDFQDHGNLYSWLLDPEAIDQFSVMADGGNKTLVMSNTHDKPVELMARERFTETYVRWSPQGTYLATFHGRGIALWGGSNFEQILRLPHDGVQLIDFSPCERFVVTFSPVPDIRNEEPHAVIIWDICTGKKKRSFHGDTANVWPIFQWSADGEYFARRGEDAISVYETQTFGLLDKKSLKIGGVRGFSWSPCDNVIAYWVPENSNQPCRVTLVELPSRREIASKNLFSVKDCRMHWQQSGDFLAVKVDRYTKMKVTEDGPKYGGIYYNFEIFRIREKHVPVDKIEVKEPIVAFGWEPTGNKLCFLRGEGSAHSADFYKVVSGGKLEFIKTLERRQANHVFWSPTGQFVVLAGLRSMNGAMEFIDTTDMTQMAQVEHFMATDLEWDPSGRYVASGVSWWGHKMDNAYWLWSFQGTLLSKQQAEGFCQLIWRPRPKLLLGKEQIKDIKKNLKSYQIEFEQLDRVRTSKASAEQLAKRKRLHQQFSSWRDRASRLLADTKRARLQLRGGVDTDELENEADFEEQKIEFLQDATEVVEE